ASNTINAPNETKGGILSTFRQKIRLFSSRELLSEMLSYSDFDMRELGSGKTAVFMIIHDEKKTYHSLMTIFIKQCYETLIDVAQENGGKLPFRTNFILDEFANMPPLKDVDSMISAARSRDIRFTFIIQNFAQLNDVYGAEVAEVIKGNCGNLVYLISTELKALEEISKMCGDVKSDEKDKTSSTPLVTVSDLQKLKLFEAIIIRLRTNPFRTKLEPDFKMDWGIERQEESYPARVKQPISVFDLKKYVIDEKSKKMNDSFNGDMMNFNNGFNNPMRDNSFRPSPGFNPFSENREQPKKPNIMDNLDIDAMMKDIDAKLKALDLESEENEKKIKQQNQTMKNDSMLNISDEDIEIKIPPIKEEPVVTTIKEEPKPKVIDKPKAIEKPKVNVDADSFIVNENVITDDEFFDDFFGDE
ncbi:MAG: type IV secretory system conjugative DNA transfer family protein, partial [Bacilli bacterium]